MWCDDDVPILIIKNQLCFLQSFNLRSFSVTIKCRYIQYTDIIIKHQSNETRTIFGEFSMYFKICWCFLIRRLFSSVVGSEKLYILAPNSTERPQPSKFKRPEPNDYNNYNYKIDDNSNKQQQNQINKCKKRGEP